MPYFVTKDTPRQPSKVRLRRRLNEILADLPDQAKTAIYSTLTSFKDCQSRYDFFDRTIDNLQPGIAALVREAKSCRAITDRLIRILDDPLMAADRVGQLYQGVAFAVAQIVRGCRRQATVVIHTLRRQLHDKGWIWEALEVPLQAVPDARLECLYDAVCLNTVGAYDAARVLAKIQPGRRVTDSWLGSGFPGPRAAAIAYLADRPDFADRLPALAITATADPDDCVRAVAVAAMFGRKCRVEFKPHLIAALSDRDWAVRLSVAYGLGRNRRWTRILLPELVSVLHDHDDDFLKMHVAEAIGRLKTGASAAIPALKALARHEHEDLSEAARKALARLGAGDVGQTEVA